MSCCACPLCLTLQQQLLWVLRLSTASQRGSAALCINFSIAAAAAGTSNQPTATTAITAATATTATEDANIRMGPRIFPQCQLKVRCVINGSRARPVRRLIFEFSSYQPARMSIENVYRVCQYQKKLRSGGGDRRSASGMGDRGSNLGPVDANEF
ncbi:hypothetical protein ACLKA7_002619 [Drosophila subpalustris]